MVVRATDFTRGTPMNTTKSSSVRDVGGVYFVDDNRYHGLDASARPCAVVVSAMCRQGIGSCHKGGGVERPEPSTTSRSKLKPGGVQRGLTPQEPRLSIGK